jgi:S-sulfosulfanyl-L-cysteine sulfohydrolase
MTVRGRPVEANKRYKIASWAPVTEGAAGEPIWNLVARYLRDKKTLESPRLNRPELVGVGRDPGASPDAYS